jgi:hypothetical protein
LLQAVAVYVRTLHKMEASETALRKQAANVSNEYMKVIAKDAPAAKEKTAVESKSTTGAL